MPANNVWTRDAAIQRLRPVLWRYLSDSAQILRSTQTPSELGELTPNDMQRLAICHLAVSPTTISAVRSAEELLRSMPASISRDRRELFGVVHGRVDWQRTTAARVARSDPTLFICDQADRRYDTSLGRLLKLALRSISDLHAQARLVSTMPGRLRGINIDDLTTLRLGDQVAYISAVGRTLLQSPKLRQVRSIGRTTLRDLDALQARYPDARSIIEFVDSYYRIVTAAEEGTLRPLLESQVFAPSEPDRLFELEVGLELVDVLRTDGFSFDEPVSLLPDSTMPFASVVRHSERCQIWWQRNPWGILKTDPKSGVWRQVLMANRIPNPRGLMPDFVVTGPSPQSMLLVEVKHSDVGAQREREGLRDMVTYLTDLGPVTGDDFKPRGLVVAWDAVGEPDDAGVTIQTASQSTVSNVFRSICSVSPSGKWYAPR